MITYFYYRLTVYFRSKNQGDNTENIRALIATSGILIINMVSILFFINSIFYKGQNLLNIFLKGNYLIDRFIILPILVSPVFLLIYYLGKKRLEKTIDIYKNEPPYIRKKKGWRIVLYIILTIIVFQLALASPVYIK